MIACFPSLSSSGNAAVPPGHGTSDSLIVFFAGWGRDFRDVEHLDTHGADLLTVWNYADTQPFPFKLLLNYRTIRLCAWSFGVFAAAKTFADSNAVFSDAVAVNGTLQPASDTYGIPPNIINGTLDNWLLPAARARFEARMAGSAKDAARLPRPDRSVEDQACELRFLLDAMTRTPEPPNCFHHAIAATDDRILPFDAQIRAWSQIGIPVMQRHHSPHDPFPGLTSFEEIFAS